jgi:hypothetical protein
LKYSIDVLFFDQQGTIIKCFPDVAPRRLVIGPSSSAFALEVYSHHQALSNWSMGMTLEGGVAERLIRKSLLYLVG